MILSIDVVQKCSERKSFAVCIGEFGAIVCHGFEMLRVIHEEHFVTRSAQKCGRIRSMLIRSIFSATLWKIKKRHRGCVPSGALLAFLHERCFYVQGSLLSVAPYPKALAKIGTIEDISKFFPKKLRKSYVNTTWNLKARGCALLANVPHNESQQRTSTSEPGNKKGSRWSPLCIAWKSLLKPKI